MKPDKEDPKDLREPQGVLMTARMYEDGLPVVQMVHDRLEPRQNARAYALRHMRENYEHCVLFIREDGSHETWGRGELEANLSGVPPQPAASMVTLGRELRDTKLSARALDVAKVLIAEFPSIRFGISYPSDVPESEESYYDIRRIASVLQAAMASLAVSENEVSRRDSKRLDWQPIKTAPKDGTWVLLAGDSGCWIAPVKVSVGRYDAGYRHYPWRDHSNNAFQDGGTGPTHWMPLPSAPQSASQPTTSLTEEGANHL